jgi:hypothetical protein
MANFKYGDSRTSGGGICRSKKQEPFPKVEEK